MFCNSLRTYWPPQPLIRVCYPCSSQDVIKKCDSSYKVIECNHLNPFDEIMGYHGVTHLGDPEMMYYKRS